MARKGRGYHGHSREHGLHSKGISTKSRPNPNHKKNIKTAHGISYAEKYFNTKEIIVNPDNFYLEELEQVRSLYEKYGTIKWGDEELAKKIYEEEMPEIPLSMFISGMCCGQGKVIISPFPNYMFRYASEEEFENVKNGDRTGGFWTSNPVEYASNNVLFVARTRPNFYKYQIDQDAPNGKRDFDEILAVYVPTGLGVRYHPFKPIYVKEGFDIKNLDYDYDERVKEFHKNER